MNFEQQWTTQQKEPAVSWSKQNWYEMPVTFYITLCCSGLVELRSWSLAVLNHRLVLPLRVDFLCGLQDFRNIAIGFPKLAPSTCIHPQPLKTLKADRPDRSQDNHNFFFKWTIYLVGEVRFKPQSTWYLKKLASPAEAPGPSHKPRVGDQSKGGPMRSFDVPERVTAE